jgi:LVIVD repeat
MKRLAAILAATALVIPGIQSATAGPSAGGISTDNVEYITTVPFENGTATGARVFGNGKFLVVTTWKSFSIYDISDPAAPAMLSVTPFAADTANQGTGFRFENEDVATNGKIMLFSESLPQNILWIYDIEDKTNPVLLSTVPGAGNHTTDCILNCKWGYGSEGTITDLRNPAKPKLMKETWGDGTTAGNNGHDITEVAPGLVLTSTNPMMVLDARKDPLHPKELAISEQMPGFVHSNLWPRDATDRWALSTGETWTPTETRCDEQSAGLSTHDTTNYKKTHSFKLVDTYRMANGMHADGNPVTNAPFGCSSHWFDTHPDWNNGGVVAAGFYNHGTRFLQVDSKGKIKEVGWFLPHGGGTSAAYWVNDEIVYAIDYQRGFDVLRYAGK